jgi:hypothetical protein
VSSGLQRIKGWFRREASAVEEVAEGGAAVATPPPGSASAERDESDRETSTNAQVEGAVGQPWSDSD